MNKLLLCFLLLTITSCVKDVDFEQAENFELRPVGALSLTSFGLESSKEDDVPFKELSNTSNFEVFNNSEVKKRLLKVKLDLEIKNQFDNAFKVEIAFLDDNKDITYKLPIIIVPAAQVAFKYEEIIEIATHKDFLNTSRVQVVFKVKDGEEIKPRLKSVLEFKSRALLYLKIDKHND